MTELENYKFFNKLNNGEPIQVIQFFSDLSHVEEYRLKNALILTYETALQPDFHFEKYLIDIFPFLVKQSIQYREVLRRVFLFFDVNEANTINDEEQDKHIRQSIVTKFLSFVTAQNGRMIESETTTSAGESSSSSSSSAGGYSFTVRVYSSKSTFTQFYQRYSRCSSFFHWSQMQLKGKLFHDYYASEILEDFLFLGDYLNATTREQLIALGITHIIDATNTYYSRDIAKEEGIGYLAVNVWDADEANIAEHFPAVIEFIEEAKKSLSNPHILIHCRAGFSRSPTLVLAYLMSRQNMTLKAAVTKVVNLRPVVCPNDGFRKQLYEYEIQLRGETSVQSLNDFLTLVHENSRLFSAASTIETDYDRTPIAALKNRGNQMMLAQEYPDEKNSGQENQEPLDGNHHGEGNEALAKPKKPFLKRGEGKTIHQEIAKQKRLEIEQKKKEIRENKIKVGVPPASKPDADV